MFEVFSSLASVCVESQRTFVDFFRSILLAQERNASSSCKLMLMETAKKKEKNKKKVNGDEDGRGWFEELKTETRVMGERGWKTRGLGM